MATRQLKPTSPGQRFRKKPDYAEITETKPLKKLAKGKRRISGRNHKGRITIRHRGGAHRRRYREIDFRRNKDGVPAKVASIEYDPNRTSRIALLHYFDGEKRYIVAPAGLEVGATINSGAEAEFEVGNCLPLSRIPLGSVVHNVELTPGQGRTRWRAGRRYGRARLLAKEGVTSWPYCGYHPPRFRQVRGRLSVPRSVGLGNEEHSTSRLPRQSGPVRIAGCGRRPKVRGVVMNPVDHPARRRRRPDSRVVATAVSPWGVRVTGASHPYEEPEAFGPSTSFRGRKRGQGYGNRSRPR